MKQECIEYFLELIRNNNVFKDYFTEEDARRILDKNIKEITLCNQISKDGKELGGYSYFSKEIKIVKQNDNAELYKIITHEMIHALLSRWCSNNELFICGSQNCRFERPEKSNGKLIYKNMTYYGQGINEGITELIADKLYAGIGKTYLKKDGRVPLKDGYLSTIKQEHGYAVETNVAKQLETIFGIKFLIDYAVEGNLNIHDFGSQFETLNYKLPKEEKLKLYKTFKRIVSDLDDYNSGKINNTVLLRISKKIMSQFFRAKVKQAKMANGSELAYDMLQKIKKYSKIFPEVYATHPEYKELNIRYEARVAKSICSWKILRCKVKELFIVKKSKEKLAISEAKDESQKLKEEYMSRNIEKEWRKNLGISRAYTTQDMTEDLRRDKKKIQNFIRNNKDRDR